MIKVDTELHRGFNNEFHLDNNDTLLSCIKASILSFTLIIEVDTELHKGFNSEFHLDDKSRH